jgi:cob(I)alamin adenosyltransferase
MKKGLLIIFTGHGKGKTTAALGQITRAAGHGKKTAVVQFIKGGWKYGEIEGIKGFGDLVDFNVAGEGFLFKKENLDEDRKTAQKAWETAQKFIESGEHFLVILDELTYLFHYGFLSVDEVLQTLSARNPEVHVIITGRDAPGQLIEAADLVTEMKVLKHPFQNGVKAQKGIEW